MTGNAVVASSLGWVTAKSILSRLAAGEEITAEERLGAIQDLMAFSPTDWSGDKELWCIYKLAFTNPGENL